MAARSIASLTVSFGLVAIPVKLYSATRSSGSIHFNLLHKKDGSRLKQQYICAKEGVVVEHQVGIASYREGRSFGDLVNLTAEVHDERHSVTTSAR